MKAFLIKHLNLVVLGALFSLIELCFYHYGVSYTVAFDFINAYPIWSPLIFILVCTLAMMGLIPTLPLNLGAGIFFGGIYGGILAAIGATCGSIGSFVIARNLSNKSTQRLMNNHLMSWINNHLNMNGWRIIAMVRLCPGIPTGPVNYLFGLTKINLRTYSLVTFIFLLPPSLVISVMGQHLGVFFLSKNDINILYIVMTLMMGATFLLFVMPTLFKKLFRIKQMEGT